MNIKLDILIYLLHHFKFTCNSKKLSLPTLILIFYHLFVGLKYFECFLKDIPMVGSIALSKSFRYFYVAHAAPVAPAAAVALLNLHVWPLVEQAAVVPHPQSPVLRQILCRLPDMPVSYTHLTLPTILRG